MDLEQLVRFPIFNRQALVDDHLTRYISSSNVMVTLQEEIYARLFDRDSENGYY